MKVFQVGDLHEAGGEEDQWPGEEYGKIVMEDLGIDEEDTT